MQNVKNKHNTRGVPSHSPKLVNNLITLPDDHPAIQHLFSSGLTRETINKTPLWYIDGSNPTPEDKQVYKQYLHQPFITKDGSPRYTSCLIFIYPGVEEYGRVRDLLATGDNPRYKSPQKKDDAEPSSHLYIPVECFSYLRSPKAVYVKVEGEKGTLKLYQELKPLEDILGVRFVVVGAGTTTFLCSPELHTLPLKDHDCYIVFDADSAHNSNVEKAELKLAGYCRARQVKTVKSWVWDYTPETKGIDDFLVVQEREGNRPTDVLVNLLETAISPLEKFRDLDLKTVCENLAKVEQYTAFAEYQLDDLVNELTQYYNTGKRYIKSVLKSKVQFFREQRTQKQLEHSQAIVKQKFNIGYVPQFPDGFITRNGNLATVNGDELCKLLLLSKYVETADPTTPNMYIFTDVNGNEIRIDSDDFSNATILASVLNRVDHLIDQRGAKLFQTFAAGYYLKNISHILRIPYYDSTGWSKENNRHIFRLPRLSPDAEYERSIALTFQGMGGDLDKVKHYEFYRNILTKHNAGAIVLLCLATPVIGLGGFGPLRQLVNIYGLQGEGKTIACLVGMSLYGDPFQLMLSLNSTSVGQEISFTMHRDLPVLLDEVQTASGDAKRLATRVLELIYQFSHGKGRTRGTKKIELRHHNDYRGVAIFTSERSMNSILSHVDNTTTGGARRRTFEFPVKRPKDLWNFTEDTREQELTRIYEFIHAHNGIVGPEWITYILQPDVITQVRTTYADVLKRIEQQGAHLRGSEHLVSLMTALIPFAEKFFELEKDTILVNVHTYMTRAIEHQQANIDKHIRNQVDRFQEQLRDFILVNIANFVTDESKIDPRSVFGKRDTTKELEKETQAAEPPNVKIYENFYLIPEALNRFCNLYGFEKETLFPQLTSAGILQQYTCTRNGKPQQRDTCVRSLQGQHRRVYHFKIEQEQEDGVSNNSDTEE